MSPSDQDRVSPRPRPCRLQTLTVSSPDQDRVFLRPRPCLSQTVTVSSSDRDHVLLRPRPCLPQTETVSPPDRDRVSPRPRPCPPQTVSQDADTVCATRRDRELKTPRPSRFFKRANLALSVLSSASVCRSGAFQAGFEIAYIFFVAVFCLSRFCVIILKSASLSFVCAGF